MIVPALQQVPNDIDPFEWFLGTALAGVGMGVIVASLILLLALYIYFALALMTIARKTGTEPAWLAWIPILNVYLLWKVSMTPAWTILVVAIAFLFSWIPILGFVFFLAIAGIITYWYWRVSERRGHAPWVGLGASPFLSVIPFIGTLINLVTVGLLAWMDKPIGR